MSISQSIKTPVVDIPSFLESGALLVSNKGRVSIGWGRATRNDKGQPGSFYHTDFYLKNQNPWVAFENFAEVEKEELVASLEGYGFESFSAHFEGPTREEWKKKFTLSQQYIQGGHCKKIVPVVREKAHHQIIPSELAGLIIQSLLSKGGHAYGLWEPKSGFIGVSPELLFQLEEGKTLLTTMSLAGTHGLNLEEGSLLKSSKDRIEHELVIEGIESSLESLGVIEKGETFEYKTKSLKHLRTDIQLKSLEALDEQDLVSRLHPTPALGVSPKQSLRLYLDVLEKHRGVFGAPFGCQTMNSDSHFIVAIRNLSWENQEIAIWSGCGLVEQSNEDLEWDELLLKRNSVKTQLGVSS